MIRLYSKIQSALLNTGKICLIFALFMSLAGKLNAQEQKNLSVQDVYVSTDTETISIPRITNPPSSVALKTNLLYAATLTPNLALEIGLGKKTSLELAGGYNFYDPSNNKFWKHWLVQPEFRYWFCERFNGSFIGIHALGGQYNFSKLRSPFGLYKELRDHRFEGEYYGGGIVFGYQWILSKRWNFELSVGAGYVRAHYNKYECTTCGRSVESGTKNYLGPTKAAVSLLLFL